MDIALVTNNSANTEKPQSPALKSTTDLDSEKKRLYKAAKEMESLFLYQLLKTMRETIPKSELNESFGTGDSPGKDIYTQMFDQELALKMSGVDDRSLANQLYESLERVLELQYNESGQAKQAETVTIDRALPRQNYLKVKEETPAEIKITPERPASLNNTKQPESLDKIISQAAEKYKLNPKLIAAVIKAESNGDPKAVSTAGAKGLMQLIDTTATDMGVKNVFDPQENVEGGAKYLRQMINRFGDVKMALAAYNAGPETVKRYEGIPPYRETVAYVNRIMKTLPEQDLYY